MAFCAAVPRPGHRARVGRGVPDRDAERRRVGQHPGQRRGADAATGGVGDPGEGVGVLRVGEDDEVGQRVLDLGAVVELRPADDLVGDLAADQRVLQDPGLRVRPVEDGDLRAAEPGVEQPLDLADDEPRLGVLVVHLADADGVAVAEVRPQRLELLRAVVGDDRVRGAQDRLRRAVVLLELDDRRVGIVVLEVQEVADVGSTEAVDRVVGDEPVRDEVVRVLDVDVVHRRAERDLLDQLDHVVAAVLGEHHHPGTHGRRGDERQGVAPLRGRRVAQPGQDTNGDGERGADPIHDGDGVAVVLEARLVAPAGRAALRGPHAEPGGAQRLRGLRIAPADGHVVHRRATPPVAAERERHLPPTALERTWRDMRMVDRQAVVVKQPQTAPEGVDGGEHLVDERLIAHEAVPAALPRDERQRRDAVLQRQANLGRSRLGLRLVRLHDPRGIRVLLAGSHLHAEHARVAAVGVDPRGPHTEADATPVHHVRQVVLRRQSRLEPGEVRVLGRRHDAAAAPRGDRDTHRRVAGEGLGHAGGTEVPAAVAGQHLVARRDALDRLRRCRPPSPPASRRPGTARRRRRPARFRCSFVMSCSSRYWAWLVSWYSSTSTWRNTAW